MAASWGSACCCFHFKCGNLLFDIVISGLVDSNRAVSSVSDLSAALRIHVIVFRDLRRLSYSSDIERRCSPEFCGAILSRDMILQCRKLRVDVFIAHNALL